MVICRFAQVCQQCRAGEELPGWSTFGFKSRTYPDVLAAIEAFSTVDDSLWAALEFPIRTAKDPFPPHLMLVACNEAEKDHKNGLGV